MEPFSINSPSIRSSDSGIRDSAQQDNEAEASRLIEELQAHRVELEMQNRALRQAQTEFEASVRLFADLYDHVPSGYLTLSPSGQIVQANLTAAEWLQRERRELVGTFLRMFLAPFDAGRFAAYLEHCEHSEGICHFGATLQLDAATSLPVQLASRRVRCDSDQSVKLHCALTRMSKLHEVQHDLAEARA